MRSADQVANFHLSCSKFCRYFLVSSSCCYFVLCDGVGLSGFCLTFSLTVVVQLGVIKTCNHGNRAVESKGALEGW